MLMSSSRSGQWMPIPPPMSSQRPRSCGDPVASRGYHASGAESVRPSASTTTTCSSVTRTSEARVAGGRSVREEVMPVAFQNLLMRFHKLQYAIELPLAEAQMPGDLGWVEPDLRHGITPANVNVWGLEAVSGKEKDAVGTDAKHGGHGDSMGVSL